MFVPKLRLEGQVTWMILLVLLLKRPNSQYSSRSKYWGGLSIHPLLSLGLRQGLCGEGGGLSLSHVLLPKFVPKNELMFYASLALR